MNYIRNFALALALAVLFISGCEGDKTIGHDEVDDKSPVESIADEDAARLEGAVLEVGYWYLEGQYLKAKDGAHFIISDQGPCRMKPTDDSIVFDDLTDGDRIKVKITVIEESYPLQAPIYGVEKLSDGEYSDIDAAVISQLSDLGWVQAGN